MRTRRRKRDKGRMKINRSRSTNIQKKEKKEGIPKEKLGNKRNTEKDEKKQKYKKRERK